LRQRNQALQRGPELALAKTQDRLFVALATQTKRPVSAGL